MAGAHHQQMPDIHCGQMGAGVPGGFLREEGDDLVLQLQQLLSCCEADGSGREAFAE
ncbi:hypothetical protein D3C86_2167040 [compost metagenome]